MHDQITISLGNTEPIPANYQLRISIWPIQNPPSVKPLNTFSGQTGDEHFDPTESFNGAVMHNILPGQLSDLSFVEILGSYEVAAKNQPYSFTIELKDNDIPRESLLIVQWPLEWQLQCLDGKYTVKCTRGCQFQDKALVCDQTANSLKLFGGFESQRGYISADTGQIMF